MSTPMPMPTASGARDAAVLRRVAEQLGPYPARRELSLDPASSCYLGLVESTLVRQGLAIDESDVFLFGGAYELKSQQDEYGEPDLWFSPDATTRACCDALGCEYDAPAIDHGAFESQLEGLLGDGKGGVIAWTYSKELGYTTDVYASRGYIHSVLVLGLDRARMRVRVLDRQVATTPHVSCRAEMPIDRLRIAIASIPWPAQYPGLGNYHRVRPAGTRAPTAWARRAALKTTAARLAHAGGATAIERFGGAVQAWLDHGPGALTARAESSNRVITTDHVLPSRRALATSLRLAGLGGDPAIMTALAAATRAWEIAAAGLRRIARGAPPPPGRWLADLAGVTDTETTLWRVIEASC